MSANFTPNQNEYKNLTPFKNWLLLQINTWGQNNFPFVESDFDELTNYGMMQKLMGAVNDVISNENDVEEDMTHLFSAFTELQTYVNDYFDNLDVQDEINQKLDEMASDGTLTQLIKGYVDPYIEEQNQTINNFKSSVNNSLSNMQTEINSVVSGTPLPATSTSGMTDTTRLYVNTTDGYVYYYNGSEWTQGWLYQSTENQETIDARENFDGVSYNTLKDHLNTQFSSLYDYMKKINYNLNKEQSRPYGLDYYFISTLTGHIADGGTKRDYVISTMNCLFAKKGSSIKLPSGEFRVYLYEDNVAINNSTFISCTDYVKEYVFTNDSYFRIIMRIDNTQTPLWDEEPIALNEDGQALLDDLETIIYLDSKEEFEKHSKIIKPKFYVGNMNINTGLPIWDDTNRMITNLIPINKECLITSEDIGYNLSVGKFDENENFLGRVPLGGNKYLKIDNCAFIRLCIGNSYPELDYTTLSQLEIDDIVESITIYTYEVDDETITNNYINNFGGQDIINNRYFPSNIVLEKSININAFDVINTTSISHDSSYATQGIATDRKRYLYLTIDNDDDKPCGLIKYDLLKNEVVNSIYETNYGHGNGMTYIEKFNQLWITSYNDDSDFDNFKISKVNAETLEFVESFDLETIINNYLSDVFDSVHGVGVLTYNKIHDKVVYLCRNSMGKDGVLHKALVVCDTNNNPINYILVNELFAGGLDSDSNYIYMNLPTYNKIRIYDWNLNVVGEMTYSLTGETEGIVILDKTIYINMNYQNIKLYKLTSNNYTFR